MTTIQVGLYFLLGAYILFSIFFCTLVLFSTFADSVFIRYLSSTHLGKPVVYHLQQVVEWLEGPKCGICLAQYWSTGDMAPRVMNCGHTYCGSCIEIFAEQKDGMVICPFCTRTHFCNTIHPLPFFSENHLLIILCSSLITVNLWKCQTCRKKYSSQDVSRTPRVYSTCGHTSCEACVESDFTQKKRVVCLTCEGRSGGITVVAENWKPHVPINYAIRDLLKE
ncbi:RING-type domain-containing protein [Caenorhabditis elegans]|uniref:RING-type domain-containing protein n=1 Tax=Caenorhabditis elegans TaxID=6239 RepID=A0A7R9SVA6_CAEEL|nr:RING-type domain-containing protein [Caenorhabditis elegans]CAD8126365.1 RING-type domain-containing protein [Caenorhabditis elegans]